MNRSIRQLRRCLAVASAVMAVVAMPAVSVPAAAIFEPTPEELIVTTPPAGYAVSTDPAAISGEFTMDQLATMTGQTVDPSVQRAAARMKASARTWDAADGSRLVVLLVRLEEASDTPEFLAGLIDELDESASYDTGVEGTLGRVVFGGMPSRLVAWHQGRYAVQIFSSAQTSVAAEAAALQVATAQIELLRGTAGAPSSEFDHGIGKPFVLGIVGGVAVVIVFVAYRSIRARRRKPAPVTLQPWMVKMDQHRMNQPVPRQPWQQGPPGPPTSPPPG